MFAASTPLDPRKRRRSEVCPTPGISPIRKRGVEDVKPYALPKLPKGTSLEVRSALPLKKLPLAENQNAANLPPVAMIEAQTRKSLAYLNGIIALPPPQEVPKKRRSSAVTHRRRQAVNIPTYQPSQAVANVLKSVDQNSKKNLSQFNELVVISDSDEEPEHSVHLRTRKSVASKRKRAAVVSNVVSDVPSVKHFTKMDSKSITGSRNSCLPSFQPYIPSITEYGVAFAAPPNFPGEHTTIIKSEPQEAMRTRNTTRLASGVIVKSEALPSVPENGFEPDHHDVMETPEHKFKPEPEIAKFSIADVESWKEMKDQQGIFFSKAPAPQSTGTDGDAFPARAGYLKMEAKKILDIQSCANNVVFTVVKGKGRMKNKTEMKGSNPKTDMIVGDILTVPQGSTFNFTNLGTKNDLIMSYVKLS